MLYHSAARQKHFWDVNIKKYFNNNELIRIPWKNQEKNYRSFEKID